jgi:hypothetical protein
LLTEDVLLTASGSILTTPVTEQTITPTWSRPTGTSLIWVADGRLLKAGIDQPAPIDISFLARHDEVAYHPAGFEIASTGEAEDGIRGIWLSSNLGEDPRLMVRAEEATPHEFTFTQEGVTAYFLADHGDHWHVHHIFLVLPEDNPTANEFDATIEYETQEPLSHLVVSPWDGVWAVQEGTCGAGSRVVINGTLPVPDELAEMEAHPVGWLPGAKLVVAAHPNGCDQTSDIWLIDNVFQDSPSATLLVRNVDAAAIRAAVPDPPSALGDVSLDEFA